MKGVREEEEEELLTGDVDDDGFGDGNEDVVVDIDLKEHTDFGDPPLGDEDEQQDDDDDDREQHDSGNGDNSRVVVVVWD